MKAFTFLYALLASSALTGANPIQVRDTEVSPREPASLFLREDADQVTCTTDSKSTVFSKTDVQNAIDKFNSYINTDSSTWPKAGTAKTARTYPSRTTLKKGPAVQNGLENLPGCAAEGSDTLQWWEFPLITNGPWNGGNAGSQGPARIVLTITDNGAGKNPRYTDVVYCLSMAYTTKQANVLEACQDD